MVSVFGSTTTLVAPAASASYAATYSYDQLNRPINVTWILAIAQTLPAASSTVTFVHGYNANNRRIGQTATDSSWWAYPATASSTAYTANSLNQYSAVGAVSPSYDGNGNLTGDGTFTYGYDTESRLASITGGGVTASYAYDAQGRRKMKTVGTTKTVYITDADNREVAEYDGTTGALSNWYAYNLSSDGVLNQMNAAGTTRATFIPDIQGSVIGSLDASTGALTKTGYQPFGQNPANYTGSFRYTARRIDPETGGSASQPSGLYYYRARMYSPTLGRFLQADPIGYAGGNNLFAYVGNDPLNNTDPSRTLHIANGASVGATIPVPFPPCRSVSLAAPGGFALDTSGGFAYYGSIGGGPAAGASAKILTAQAAVSNAPTVQDLSGPSVTQSFVAGAGVGGSLDYGRSIDTATGKATYYSLGGSIGDVTGLGYSANYSNTNVWDTNCLVTAGKSTVNYLVGSGSNISTPSK